MEATCTIHVPVLRIRATILPKAEIPTAQPTIRLLVLQEAHRLTVRRRITTRLQGPSRITARLAEAIRRREANLIAHLRGLTVSRRTVLLREVTAHHPAVEAAVAAVVQAVLREVQDNLRLS